jgi:hypothetical protein
VVAVHIAVANGHYVSVPFLLLFLFGFSYVGALSVWQGGFGQALRGLFQREDRAVVPVSMMSAPFIAAMPDATPGPMLLSMDARSPRSSRARAENNSQDSAVV